MFICCRRSSCKKDDTKPSQGAPPLEIPRARLSNNALQGLGNLRDESSELCAKNLEAGLRLVL